MIKIIIASVILSTVIIGCNNVKQENNASNEAIEIQEIALDIENNMAVVNNDWVHEILLNNGSKWEANIETTQGVSHMLDILKNSKTENLNDYHALALKLNDAKNILVKECTMKGPAHDNLHLFLHPLIEKIDILLTVTSLDKAVSITMSIKENLDAYGTYFQ